MDHRKQIEQLANELSKAHGCIDALTAAFVGILQAMREDPALTAEVIENMRSHQTYHEGLAENSPFAQGFQRTQSYIAEILERTNKPRLNS